MVWMTRLEHFQKKWRWLPQECGCPADAFINDDPSDEFHELISFPARSNLATGASLRSFHGAGDDCSTRCARFSE
jgi:hypothetical protein